MRLDHIALRVPNRHITAQFYIDNFGYRLQQEFQIHFDEGETADCLVLIPPEKYTIALIPFSVHIENVDAEINAEYHLPPEIFISDGSSGSIVGNWVAARGGIGGVHHMAYLVPDVDKAVEEWKSRGIEFSSDAPIVCEGLKQIFTKELKQAGNIVVELLERAGDGFCKSNVLELMRSSVEKNKI